MRYYQVRDVYNHIHSLNIALLEFFERTLLISQIERERIFLHFLIDRQKDINSYLASLSQSEISSVLDTWVDEEMESEIKPYIESLQLAKDTNTDVILTMVEESNQKACDWLTKVIELLGDGKAKDHIQNLLEHLNLKNKQLMHSAHRFDDL